jgi:hypothetical protein
LCSYVEKGTYGDIRNYANKDLKKLFDSNLGFAEDTKELEKEKVAEAYEQNQEKIQNDVLEETISTFDSIPNQEHHRNFFKTLKY